MKTQSHICVKCGKWFIHTLKVEKTLCDNCSYLPLETFGLYEK